MTPSSLPEWPEPEPTYSFGCDATRALQAEAGERYQRARAEAWEARCRYLVNEIKAHDQACDKMCGLGDQEGVACKYRPYFPRHCPSCPKDDKLDHWLEAIGELPPTATP